MPLLRIAVACLVLLASPGLLRAANDAPGLNLKINGLKPGLEDGVRSGLTLQQYLDRSVSEAQLRQLVSRGEVEIVATLEAWGYYSGAVKSEVAPNAVGSFDVVYDVDPGEPTLVTESRVTVDGDAAQVPAVASVLKSFVPRVGERFDHAQYEASKTAIEKALGDAGFLGAKLVTHRVAVHAVKRTAAIELAWNGGPRYKFGSTKFSGGQFTPALLDRFMPWREGDDYSNSKLLDMQKRLVVADYFSTWNTVAQSNADTDFGSGPLFSCGAFLYSATSASGISSRRMSVGNSTSTGPGRPFLTVVKARRSVSIVASATVTCSHNLVTWRKFSAALKFGCTWLMLRA